MVGSNQSYMYVHVYMYIHAVHPESFRSNALARKIRPRVNRSGEFACVYLRLRALFAIKRVRVRACDCAYVNSI